MTDPAAKLLSQPFPRFPDATGNAVDSFNTQYLLFLIWHFSRKIGEISFNRKMGPRHCFLKGPNGSGPKIVGFATLRIRGGIEVSSTI